MINVLKPGFYSSIQDLGRYSGQHYGVPISGAMDLSSASLANSILGNPKNAAVLEVTMTGPELDFLLDTQISITGADMQPRVNGREVLIDKVISIKSGDVVSFGRLQYGFRSYIGILGGFETEVVMGSRSMYLNITKAFRINKNDVLKYSNVKNSQDQKVNANLVSFQNISNTIEVFKGPEYDLLGIKEKELLIATTFTISRFNNRMGYQLEEDIPNKLSSIITSVVIPGTVQLTPSGKLIVLMRDCQTTGGYPRILQLSDDAINQLSQKFTGHTLNFKFIEH